MAKQTFKRRSNGQTIKRLRNIERGIVKVGWLSAAGEHPNAEMPLHKLALIHELGLGNVPARPVLRPTIRNGRRRYNDLHKTLIRKRLQGKLSHEATMIVLGQSGADDVKQAIVDLKDPPNSKETTRRKGSSNPLIDSGLLRQSVNWGEL